MTARQRFISGAALASLAAWLLLESPALYYYVQVLPLFVVAIVLALSRRMDSGRVATAIIGATSLCLSYFAVMDAVNAGRVSWAIHRDGDAAINLAVDSCTTSGQEPIVLAQNPAIATLEHRHDLQLATAHLVSFPTTNKPLAKWIQDLGVNYLLLYAPHDGKIYSDDYAALRPIADSIGTRIAAIPGILLDVHRDYFTPGALNSSSLDTMLLYRLPTVAR